MPSRKPQPASPRLILAVALLALPLGGCLYKSPSTTGSIDTTPSLASASPSSLRASADELGRNFESNPGDAQTGIAYAASLRALGQHTQAVAVLQQTAIRNPNTLAVLGAYGKALADAGRLREAAEVLPRAHTPERPDWRILSAQGAIADQLGEFAQAQRFYDAALKIVPGEPSVLSNKGLSFALARRLPEAEQVLREAAQNPKADARVRQNLALVLGLQGKFADAETLVRRDASPAEAASTMAGIRQMVKQPGNWAAVRQADTGDAAALPVGPRVRSAQAKAAAKVGSSASDQVAATTQTTPAQAASVPLKSAGPWSALAAME